MTRITDLIGIKYPIFQGGMAWVADWHIAAAVSEAGGLGIIGVGGADENWLRDQIKKCREATDKPFGVNLMLMNPRAPEIAKVIAEEKVKVVTTGAGSPEKYMDMWKEAGIIVIPVTAGVALAKRMEQCGADAVIFPRSLMRYPFPLSLQAVSLTAEALQLHLCSVLKAFSAELFSAHVTKLMFIRITRIWSSRQRTTPLELPADLTATL